MYVTYSDLFSFVMMIATVISVVTAAVQNNRKKK